MTCPTVSAWVVMRCPRLTCKRPYFAVYGRRYGGDLDGPDYHLDRLAPFEAQQQPVDEIIASISLNFDKILNQAVAAEAHGLDLIAGMGYRKAL
jgi:hypothetical protein